MKKSVNTLGIVCCIVAIIIGLIDKDYYMLVFILPLLSFIYLRKQGKLK